MGSINDIKIRLFSPGADIKVLQELLSVIDADLRRGSLGDDQAKQVLVNLKSRASPLALPWIEVTVFCTGVSRRLKTLIEEVKSAPPQEVIPKEKGSTRLPVSSRASSSVPVAAAPAATPRLLAEWSAIDRLVNDIASSPEVKDSKLTLEFSK